MRTTPKVAQTARYLGYDVSANDASAARLRVRNLRKWLRRLP